MVLALLLAAQITVIAHRGEHNHHPENSLAGVQSAAALGADYAELDVRTTKDGKLVLMHDDTVDRTTDGHGAIRSLTLQQIRALHLRGGDLNEGGQVPTFEEALDTARGHIGIYLDWKDASPEALFQALSAHGMLDHVVVYGGIEQLRRLQALAPSIRVMPEADNAETLKKIADVLKPTVIAFEESDFKPELIRMALDMKADIYVDRLWAQDKPELWQDAIDRGAQGIQTNFPEELVKFLRAKNLHR
jgi:glycerophosphoryl diester phosphodiesterase